MSTNLELKLNERAEPSRPAIDIRYGQVGLVQVRVRTTDPGAILDELTGRVASAPHFFQRAGVYLDLNVLAEPADATQIRAVIDAIRRAGMLTVGLASGPPAIEELARALQLPVLSHFRASTQAPPAASAAGAASGEPAAAGESGATQSGPTLKPVPTVQPIAAATDPVGVAEKEKDSAPAAAAHFPLLHAQTVRSGQRIYARGRDLVLTASVGAGAEVMADGCLHVYGALRGRAMAGTRGDTRARVFCQEFYAELVSIAGVFRVFETIPPELAGRCVQVWLDGDNLRFDRLGG